MSRATVWRSIYSDISKRSRAFSLPNQHFASVRASCVLPTPVGPKNSMAPMGRPLSRKPVRLRRMADATAATARDWPMTSAERRSSRCASRSRSASPTRSAGTPLALLTTWAMSAGLNAFFSPPVSAMRRAAAASSSRSMALSGRKRPGK